MNVADRRMEIISFLMHRHHSTMEELAWEFGVCRRTIMRDISILSYGYPVYTKQGVGGGVFILKSYKPYNNTLTPLELETMLKIYGAAEEEDKRILSQVIGKYGPDKLKI